MKRFPRVAIVLFVSLSLAFAVSFLVSADPTGVRPVVGGGVLTPVCYYAISAVSGAS